MNERIKKIIAELGLKKVDFANRLHISQPFASELCSGAKAPSDRTIKDICREFNVDEHWLRTGEGDPFRAPEVDAQLAAFLAEITDGDSDDFRKRFVAMLSRLRPDQWALLEDMAKDLDLGKKKDGQP